MNWGRSRNEYTQQKNFVLECSKLNRRGKHCLKVSNISLCYIRKLDLGRPLYSQMIYIHMHMLL